MRLLQTMQTGDVNLNFEEISASTLAIEEQIKDFVSKYDMDRVWGDFSMCLYKIAWVNDGDANFTWSLSPHPAVSRSHGRDFYRQAMVQAPSRFIRGMKPSEAFSPATLVASLS